MGLRKQIVVPTRAEVLDKLIHIFEFSLDAKRGECDNINEDMRIIDDLHLDSLGLMIMAIGIETQMDVLIRNFKVDTFVTIKDIIDFVIEEKTRQLEANK